MMFARDLVVRADACRYCDGDQFALFICRCCQKFYKEDQYGNPAGDRPLVVLPGVSW